MPERRSDYKLQQYFDYGLSRDIEKGKVSFKAFPSLLLRTGVGSSPSGLFDLQVQTDPEVRLSFERTNNPLGGDCLLVGIEGREVGSVDFFHEHLRQHFTNLTGYFGFEKTGIKIFRTWYDTADIFSISPRGRYAYETLEALGRFDFGSETFYNLKIGYTMAPFILTLNLYNPLLLRPSCSIVFGPISLYARSFVRPLYMSDIYLVNHSAVPEEFIRERILYDLGIEFRGLSIGYVYYDSLLYFTTGNTASYDYGISVKPARFFYVKIQRSFFNIDLLSSLEIGTDVDYRNQVELDIRYRVAYGDYQILPRLSLYSDTDIAEDARWRFDIGVERDILGFLKLFGSVINLFDQEFVEPGDFLKRKREFLIGLEAKL